MATGRLESVAARRAALSNCAQKAGPAGLKIGPRVLHRAKNLRAYLAAAEAKSADLAVAKRERFARGRRAAYTLVLVLMPLEDYASFEETRYLLRSPRHAERLLESIVELDSGQGSPNELAE